VVICGFQADPTNPNTSRITNCYDTDRKPTPSTNGAKISTAKVYIAALDLFTDKIW